jgi:hypothetical protein
VVGFFVSVVMVPFIPMHYRYVEPGRRPARYSASVEPRGMAGARRSLPEYLPLVTWWNGLYRDPSR